MNNPEIHGYLKTPIWEGHCHAMLKMPLEATVDSFKALMTYYCYERINIAAIINESDADHPADNATVYYVKSRINAERPNSVYVFGNIQHYYDERDTADGYLAQVKNLLAMGADGIKLLDGKTADRKRLNRRLNDPIFDKMYAYLEENRIPIVSHVGDPRKNWDINLVSEYARKKGWFYDETYPTLDELYGEVDGILTKHPKLNLILVHFYFISDRYEEAVAMMEKWENFSEDIEKWRAFFVKYADRITYGTDAYNYNYKGDINNFEGCAVAGFRINQLRTMLEKTEAFEDPIYGRLVPLHLDAEILEKIYYKNIAKLLGDAKPVDPAACAVYCRKMERR